VREHEGQDRVARCPCRGMQRGTSDAAVLRGDGEGEGVGADLDLDLEGEVCGGGGGGAGGGGGRGLGRGGGGGGAQSCRVRTRALHAIPARRCSYPSESVAVS
jgi:hypothetical protein